MGYKKQRVLVFMKNILCLHLYISCEYPSDLAVKIRNHTQYFRNDPITLAEFGIDWDFYVLGWKVEYSKNNEPVLFIADLATK
jgi:hypothetical protein